MTLTATWLLPIAIIPGTWQVYEIPTTPQITEGQMPSHPEPNQSDNAVSAETQNEGGPTQEKVTDEGVPEPEASTSQEPDQAQAWWFQSSSYTSTPQPPQGHWNPNPSVMWIPPEQGYPNPMYSNSSSFHYAQSHPPGTYFTPMPGYTTPVHGYYQPADPEQISEMYEPNAYEPAAPPPVVVHTIPLPSSRPNSPPRRR